MAASTNARRGWVAGTVRACRAAVYRPSPSVAMTTGAALWAR